MEKHSSHAKTNKSKGTDSKDTNAMIDSIFEAEVREPSKGEVETQEIHKGSYYTKFVSKIQKRDG